MALKQTNQDPKKQHTVICAKALKSSILKLGKAGIKITCANLIWLNFGMYDFVENRPGRDLKKPAGDSSPSLCPKAGPIIPRPLLTNVSLIFSCETDVNDMTAYFFLNGILPQFIKYTRTVLWRRLATQMEKGQAHGSACGLLPWRAASASEFLGGHLNHAFPRRSLCFLHFLGAQLENTASDLIVPAWYPVLIQC